MDFDGYYDIIIGYAEIVNKRYREGKIDDKKANRLREKLKQWLEKSL